MNSLFRLKDNILHFLSPPAKRRRTLPATPVKEEEHRYLTPHSDVPTKKDQAVMVARLQQKYTPATAQNPRKRAREEDDDEEEEEEEEDTLLGGSNVTPDDSISNLEVKQESTSNSSGSITENLEEEIEQDLKAELPTEQDTADEKVSEYLARQAELAVRLGDIERVRAEQELHPDALFLFERIAMRSFEELLPMEYKRDFPTLPEELFTDNADMQFICHKGQSTLGGVRALQSMLTLGDRVRANMVSGASTERVMTREVNAYIKWSEKDAGYHNSRFLPVIAVVTAKPGQTNTHISTAITNQMTFLAEKHRDHLINPLTGEPGEVPTYRRQPPLLYGVILAKTLAILFTLDSADLDAKVKHLENFDFKDRSQGVWSGFGLAFMVICARDYQLTIKDEFEEKKVEDPDL